MARPSTRPAAKPWARLYRTKEWKRLRADQLARHPFCRFCLDAGRPGVPATIADHQVPHRGKDHLFFDPTNLQSLCKLCHDSAKQRQELTGRLPGGDARGIPLDPNHHWNT